MLNRRALLTGILAVVVLSVGCVRNVSVPVKLPIEAAIPIDALVARVNSYTYVERIQATVTLRFRDQSGAGEGKNKEYPAADGILILSRPESIRLRIKAPFVGKTIADMVSDGTKFRLALFYPEDKRKFVVGSNLGRYRRIDSDTQTEDPTLQQAGALANIRPQHLTQAFLIDSLLLDTPNGIYFLEQQELTERVRRGKKNAEAIRTYYVLTMLERIGDGPEARIIRRLWFDRSRAGTPLTRQELYEDGDLVTSIRYEDYMALEDGRLWPERVNIQRVEDEYSVDVIFERKALTVNGEVPVEAFQLENEEQFPVFDLDDMQNARPATTSDVSPVQQ